MFSWKTRSLSLRGKASNGKKSCRGIYPPNPPQKWGDRHCRSCVLEANDRMAEKTASRKAVATHGVSNQAVRTSRAWSMVSTSTSSTRPSSQW